MLTDEQKKQISEAFNDLDRSRRGYITGNKETLMDAARMSGLNPTEREMESRMKSCEISEHISRDQFITFLCQFEWKDVEDMKDNLKKDFEMFDSRKLGSLDAFELKNILMKEGPETIPERDVDEIISKCIKDKNGNYSIESLVSTLLSSCKS